jgi:hypothetical protein
VPPVTRILRERQSGLKDEANVAKDRDFQKTPIRREGLSAETQRLQFIPVAKKRTAGVNPQRVNTCRSPAEPGNRKDCQLGGF